MGPRSHGTHDLRLPHGRPSPTRASSVTLQPPQASPSAVRIAWIKACSSKGLRRYWALAAVRARSRVASSSCAVMKDRKSTRLNSSHTVISYAVFCLKKKNKHNIDTHYILDITQT